MSKLRIISLHFHTLTLTMATADLTAIIIHDQFPPSPSSRTRFAAPHEMSALLNDPGADRRRSPDDREWLLSMLSGCGTHQLQSPKLQSVPLKLREIKSNEACYDPLVVSIGPHHHGHPKLQSMEKLKASMALYFSLDVGLRVEALYEQTTNVAAGAMTCYEGSVTAGLNNVEFARMMFLDGCFVLQFIESFVGGRQVSNTKDMVFVPRDLLLMENQLPFEVLNALMSVQSRKELWLDKIRSFIEKQFKITAEQMRRLKEDYYRSRQGDPVCLLELVRAHLIDLSASRVDRSPHHGGGGHQHSWYRYRSAKKLLAAGIGIRRSKSPFLTDITFESKFQLRGLLSLPALAIDSSTKAVLLNMAAFETYQGPDESVVTSYVCLMDSFINDVEDVMELSSKGILRNMLGTDQQLTDVFNEMANSLVPGPNLYAGVKEGIESHFRKKLLIWMSEWLHANFTCLAFTGAVVVMVFSGIQTYFAVFPSRWSA